MASKLVARLVKPPINHGVDGRYVNALYSAAAKSNKLDTVEGDLKRLVGLYQTDSKFKDVMVGPEQKSQAYEIGLKNKSGHTSVKFLQILSERRFWHLPEVNYSFNQIMSAVRKKLPCKIISAHPSAVQGKKEVEGLLAAGTGTVAATSSSSGETPAALPLSHLKWEDTDAAALQPIKKVLDPVTGAVLPLSQLAFLQWVIFPYTLAVMYYMDFLLNYMPWWLAIIGTTATARLLFFPIFVKQNKIGVKTHNLLPQTQKIQLKLNQAMYSNDVYNTQLQRTKLKLLYKEHSLSPWDRLWPIAIQAPMYMSLFLLLRNLTNIPVEGLATGGAFWFIDLTVPDPYYALPMITCSSLFLLFEYGFEGSMNPSQGMGPVGRYVLRGMPVVMFLFIHNFPAATLLFWSTSNIFTLAYTMLLKNKWINRQLGIPQRLKHDPSILPLANMTFSGQIKEAMKKVESNKTTMDVRRLDDIAFRKAGVGPLRKTYKEPLKT